MLQRVSLACKFDEVLIVRAAADPDADAAPPRAGGGKWEESLDVLGEAEPGMSSAAAVCRHASPPLAPSPSFSPTPASPPLSPNLPTPTRPEIPSLHPVA